MTGDVVTGALTPGTDEDVARSYSALASRAKGAVWGLEEEIVFLDLETTGLGPDDRIIEIGAVRARAGEVLATFSTLVNPGVPISIEAFEITGIGTEMLEGAPPIENALPGLMDFIGDADIVAHNASFDRFFIEMCSPDAARSLCGRWLDSLELARIVLPRMRSHSLARLSEAFALPPVRHRAQDDALALAELWRVLLQAVEDLPDEVLGALATIPEPAGEPWALRRLFARHAYPRSPKMLDILSLRTKSVRALRAKPLVDAADLELVSPDAEAIAGEFREGGLLEEMYGSSASGAFEAREGQETMARAVLDAFATGVHLVAEAGTGTGKSVAYLVPAAAFALENGVGVCIATKTNTLLDQLSHAELPALAAAVRKRWGKRLRYSALKGYDNYLCLRKLERLLGGSEEAALPPASIAALLVWVAQSSEGDLETTDFQHSVQTRTSVSCSSEQCARKACRYFPEMCYLHGTRRRAMSSHIVVTNHSLLFRDAFSGGALLPPLRHVVLDEAHAVESEAREQSSPEYSQPRMRAMLRLLGGRKGGLLGSAEGIAASCPSPEDREEFAAAVAECRGAAATVETVAGSLAAYIRELCEQMQRSGYDRVETRVTPATRESAGWSLVEGVGRSLVKHLGALVVALEVLDGWLEKAGDEAQDEKLDLRMVAQGLAEQRGALALVLAGEDEAFVYSARADLRGGMSEEALRAQALDVGEQLQHAFFPRALSAVFTSATLGAADGFRHFAETVGLDRLPPEDWTTLAIPSPYDLDRQMAVYVPTDIEEPGDEAYLDQMERLLEGVHRAMGGSVLSLFTNRRDMCLLHDRLNDRFRLLGLKVALQRAGTGRKKLREEFVREMDMSLFATKSFWEGFDAKGDTLRCVVIARLPFAQPGDPLTEEMRERDRSGWWERRYLPEAVIELRQAVGRLIRSSEDVGCVVIADSRLAGAKAYAARFLAALPVRDVRLMPSDEILAEMAERFGKTVDEAD